MAGKAVTAMAQAVTVAGRLITALVPGATNAAEAVTGISTEDGSRLSHGEQVGAAALAAGEIVTAPLESHHLLPKQFKSRFSRAGLDIEDYTMDVSKSAHRLKPTGLHTKAGGDWNGVWKTWLDANPEASGDEILGQLETMKVDFGIK